MRSLAPTTRALAGTAAVVLGLLLGGCAGSTATSGSADTSPSAAASGDGMDMGDDGEQGEMAGMDMGSADRPSAPAAMICSEEISDAVRRLFAEKTPPPSSSDWSAEDRVLTCDYDVPGGELTLSVQDALQEKAGRTYYDGLRADLPRARPLTGMENFGFPAFDTEAGDVVFLKDGKTLRVDATKLPEDALPTGYSRSEAGYAIASAVIACWTE